MLSLQIPEGELFDEATSEFIKTKAFAFQIEHSLVSVSKWESTWCKPFLGTEQKTKEQIIDYIRCMTLTQHVNFDVYRYLPSDIFKKIETYIHAPMTATWFSDKENRPQSREIITSELIYYQMIAFNVPMECQKWHLNRLLTLLRICQIKNAPPKKQGKRSALASRNSLNAARRAQMNTKG